MPRSIIRQRSEQNGRQRAAGVHSTARRQVGHLTCRGDEETVSRVISLPFMLIIRPNSLSYWNLPQTRTPRKEGAQQQIRIDCCDTGCPR